MLRSSGHPKKHKPLDAGQGPSCDTCLLVGILIFQRGHLYSIEAPCIEGPSGLDDRLQCVFWGSAGFSVISEECSVKHHLLADKFLWRAPRCINSALSFNRGAQHEKRNSSDRSASLLWHAVCRKLHLNLSLGKNPTIDRGYLPVNSCISNVIYQVICGHLWKLAATVLSSTFCRFYVYF